MTPSASIPPTTPPVDDQSTMGRRTFLTLATAGVAASTLSVTIGSMTPAQALTEASAFGAAASATAPALKRDLRAMWIASVVNIDWPSATGLSADAQKAELLHWLDVARDFRLNAVFIQVRPTADAFWPSPYEPWSQYLTGVQGRDPGYDPLGFMVTEAHKRNLELHAWYNPYRVSMQADPTKLVPEHPARRNPDWIWAFGGKLYYDPGLPAVQEHIQQAILHSVQNYDIDGVHFDDYFYPYPVAGQTIPDAATFASHGAGFATIGDWRRHNVDTFVQSISQRIKQTKPWVKFGISPFGIWRNAATDPLGSQTNGSQSYDNQYADSRRWVLEGWLDYINPQIYWQIGLSIADYTKLLPWWADVARQGHTQLYVGEANYKVASGVFTDPAELSRHLALCRELDPAIGSVAGNVYFSAKDVGNDPRGAMSQVRADHYRYPALVPTMPHLRGQTIRTPVLAWAGWRDDGIRVHWVDAGGRRYPATSFAIYRMDGRQRAIDIANPANLIATQRAEGRVLQDFLDTSALRGVKYTYVVTALDRLWNESLPSIVRWSV